MNNYKQHCEQTAKILGVALAFFIPISTTVTHILLLLILLTLFSSSQWKEPFKLLVLHPVARSGMFLFFIFCIGILYSKVPLTDSLSMLGKMSKMIYIPLLIPLFLQAKWRKLALYAFMLAMFISLILSSLKTYHYLPSFLSLTRYHDCAFKNHIDTNLLMSMAAFFLGHYFFIETKPYIKFGIITLLAIMTFYILWISQGRTGYIVFAALGLLWLCQRMTFKPFLLGLTCLTLVLGITYITPSQFQQRLSSVVEELKQFEEGQGGSVGQRLEFMQSSILLVKQKPWFGFGTGAFKMAYANHAKTHQQESTTNPHNEYFNILVQWGLLGFAFFLAFIYTVFKTSLSLPKNEKYLAQGILLGILVGCFGNSFLMDFTPGYFLVTFISIMMAALPLSSTAKQTKTTDSKTTDAKKTSSYVFETGLAS